MAKYSKVAAMIAASTLVMFGLMYLNTYALDCVFFSETRAYMALLMGATTAAIMLGMYPNDGRSSLLNESDDSAPLGRYRSRASGLTSAVLVRVLSDRSIKAQRKEVDEMKASSQVLERKVNKRVHRQWLSAIGTSQIRRVH